MAYKLSNLYLSLRNGQKLICYSIDDGSIIKAGLVVGQVNAKRLGQEYHDGDNVKYIAEQPKTVPTMRRMVDDAHQTVFKTVPVSYDLTNDLITVDSLEVERQQLNWAGDPINTVRLGQGGTTNLASASAASKALIRALAERQVKGEDIVRDLKLNYGIDAGLKLIISGMGSWIVLQGKKTYPLVALINTVEDAGDK